MTRPSNRWARMGVIAASASVVVLTGMLAATLLGRPGTIAYAHPVPPHATLPEPRPFDISTLSLPCWGCLWAEQWPLHFVTDLDQLAPLGTGPANAADWFAAFSKPDGPRFAEAEAAMKRMVDHGPLPIAPKGLKVLPPNDPLLAEAAPWCDQATMRFYPDIFPVEGTSTRLPNGLFMISLARAWIARGYDTASFDDAVADFRRVIRLGRLWRQNDVVLINDLVGLACIRWGAEGIYNRAREEGRTDLALLAAVVASEGPPQKYLSAVRMTGIEVAPYLHKESGDSFALDLPSDQFSRIRQVALSCPGRRFRNQAMFNLRFVAALGTGAMRSRARAVLERLATSDDPIVAANAAWCLTTPVDDRDVRELLQQSR
jgi:hypothetical protein